MKLHEKVFVLTLWLALLTSGSAGAEVVVYVVPETTGGSEEWVWNGKVVRPPASRHPTLAEALNGLASNRAPASIRLLARSGEAETLYRRPRGGYRIVDWNPDAKADLTLTVEGQKDDGGRYLTILEGPGLKETVCGVLAEEDRRRCERGLPIAEPALVAAADILNVLEAGVPGVEAASLRAMSDVTKREACLEIERSNRVVVRGMGFRSCWLAAVRATDSSRVTLAGSRIEGSTVAFFGSGGVDRPASHLVLTDNHWIQTERRDRPRTDGCNPDADLDCLPDVWSEVPWAVSHHGFWDLLNGGFLAGKNIAGDVLVAGNRIENAYNGIRVKADASRCRDPVSGRIVMNRGFEIRGNEFVRIRDNPIEPETCADEWTIAHNRFINTHAAISTDAVEGGRMHVFGNIGWHDELPGKWCTPGTWTRMVSFDFAVGGFVPADEASDLGCTSHRRGTLLKALSMEPGDREVFFEAIYILHNSWYTRSPLFTERRASPLHFWNNAIEFTGCGRSGAEICRQTTAGCKGFPPLWTADRKALYADCFSLPGADGSSASVDFNAYNRPLSKPDGLEQSSIVVEGGPLFAGIGRGNSAEPVPPDFALPANSQLRGRACQVAPAFRSFRDLACTPESGSRADIGAVQADGSLFELNMPGVYRYIE